MHLNIDTASNTWQLAELEEAHLGLLREAAQDAAFSETEEGRKRLFPRPISEDESFMEDEFLSDWSEFVSGDIEEHFSSDIKTYLADIAAAKLEKTEDEEGKPVELYQLTMPMDHGGVWFGTLNQARLMMDQKWKFHNENDQFVPFLPPAVLGDLDPQERFTAYLRYDFYCIIQEWLVRQIL